MDNHITNNFFNFLHRLNALVINILGVILKKAICKTDSLLSIPISCLKLSRNVNCSLFSDHGNFDLTRERHFRLDLLSYFKT